MHRMIPNLGHQAVRKGIYPQLYDLRECCFGGFAYEWDERNTLSNTPEEREAFWEAVWEGVNYKDYLFSPEANREVYNFGRRKQSPRGESDTSE